MEHVRSPNAYVEEGMEIDSLEQEARCYDRLWEWLSKERNRTVYPADRQRRCIACLLNPNHLQWTSCLSDDNGDAAECEVLNTRTFDHKETWEDVRTGQLIITAHSYRSEEGIEEDDQVKHLRDNGVTVLIDEHESWYNHPNTILIEARSKEPSDSVEVDKRLWNVGMNGRTVHRERCVEYCLEFLRTAKEDFHVQPSEEIAPGLTLQELLGGFFGCLELLQDRTDADSIDDLLEELDV